MRWLKRPAKPVRAPGSPQARFPGDMLHRLEQLGRHALDPMGRGASVDVNSFCVIPFAGYIQADETEQERFLRDLYAVVASDRGGFATYGAARLAWELFGGKVLRLPAALPLIDAGIRFKLARGLPPALTLTGYELQRFSQWREQRRDSAG